jgi:hypothetical protein
MARYYLELSMWGLRSHNAWPRRGLYIQVDPAPAIARSYLFFGKSYFTTKMKCSIILSSLLLAVPSLAQTPSGFAPGTNATLDVYYGTQYISPGLVVKKSITQKAPVIGLTNITLTGKYLLAMIGTLILLLPPSFLDKNLDA